MDIYLFLLYLLYFDSIKYHFLYPDSYIPDEAANSQCNGVNVSLFPFYYNYESNIKIEKKTVQ